MTEHDELRGSDDTTRRWSALVIGGSGAIGAAVCDALAREGADVALTYRDNADAAERTAEQVRKHGRQATITQVAVEDAEAVVELVGRVTEAYGGLDTVVTAAAPIASQMFTSRIPPERFVEQLDHDTGGFFNVASAALPALRERGGSIVAICTVANRRYVLRDVLSSAPKAAVEAVVRAIAAEEGRYGVRANAVGVGILDEGMAQTLLDLGEVRERDLEYAVSRIPLGKLGAPTDIAEATAFLASQRANYITGQFLDVDGGYAL